MFSLSQNHKHGIRFLILAITLSVYGLVPAASAQTADSYPETQTAAQTTDTNISIIAISTKNQPTVTAPARSGQSACSHTEFFSFTENGQTDFNRLFTCTPLFVTVADAVKTSLKVSPLPTTSVRLYVERRGPNIIASAELVPGFPKANTIGITGPFAENLKEYYRGSRNTTIIPQVSKKQQTITIETEPEILNIFRC